MDRKARQVVRIVDDVEGWMGHRDACSPALGMERAALHPMELANPRAGLMTAEVSENVDLTKTIPGRFRDSLKAKLERELREAPFDQERPTELFREEYRVGGTTSGGFAGIKSASSPIS